MQKRCYRISKILNNNAVVVSDKGEEIIVIAVGVGFGHKVKDYLPIRDDYKLYTLQNHMVSRQFEALLNEIPFECVQLTQQIMDMARKELEKEFKSSLIVSLSDHIHFAVKTYLEGGVSYSLINEEIKRLYSREYKVGVQAIELINSHYNISLNMREAGAIALHLINSEYGDDAGQTTEILRAVDGIVNVINVSLGTELEKDSLSYSRFMIHLKFLLQRMFKGEQEDDQQFENLLISTKSVTNQKISRALDAVGAYLLKEYGHELSDTERFGLLVHLARII